VTLTAAQRQARRRERIAEAQSHAAVADAVILDTLEALVRAVESLADDVRRLSTGGGKVGQNGGQPRPRVTSRTRNVTESDVTAEGARAYAYETPPAPLRGALGDDVVTDDAHRVLVTLVRPGSVGAIHDALSAAGRDITLARTTAALVHLQAQGQVRRIPGEGVDPDRWEAVVDSHNGDLLDAPLARSLEEGPTLHVQCQDYQAHTTSHRWDGGTFVCDRCTPPHGAQALPPGLGAHPQEAAHVQAS